MIPAYVPTLGTVASTIPAYLYVQYSGDDNLQGFVSAYNGMTQDYVDWFNSQGIVLAFYPSLSQSLLDWVGTGLYNFPRPQLQSQGNSDIGAVNTEVLDGAVINSGTQTSATYYSTTDDVYKRILTWHFWKGDGKQPSIRWLKRRVMRFLMGTDGLDPAASPGPEDTQAISLTFSAGTGTITVYQSELPLLPGIAQAFKDAVDAGVLEFPFQWDWSVTLS